MPSLLRTRRCWDGFSCASSAEDTMFRMVSDQKKLGSLKKSNSIRKKNKHGILIIVVVPTSVLIMVPILIVIMILPRSDVHYALCAILACSGYVWPRRHVCPLPHVEVDVTQCYAVFCQFCVYARLNVSTPSRVEGRSCLKQRSPPERWHLHFRRPTS